MNMTVIIDYEVQDLRFPTSMDDTGSDAMNPDVDHSVAYIILKTDNPKLEGHGMVCELNIQSFLVNKTHFLTPSVL